MARRSPHNPLGEVFGYPVDNLSPEAEHIRDNKLCPFRNRVDNCTKSDATNPLGVCSVMDGDGPTITCPVRFRTQDHRVTTDAAEFFGFSPGSWTSLNEVQLNDANGRSAGNIDVVLVSYDEHGRLTNFGSLEIQAVYISGNIRQAFTYYMADRERYQKTLWSGKTARADYLSSSRKRLMPQMVYKGGILESWGKKQAVAIHRKFWDTLPKPPTASREEAELAWLIYDLRKDDTSNEYRLVLGEVVYTKFQPALDSVTTPAVGAVEDFEQKLQEKLDEKLDSPPDVPILGEILEEEPEA